jgi:hypothetical protein
LVTFCVETAFYGRLLRRDKRRDRSDRKARKKTTMLLDDLKESRGYIIGRKKL